VLKHPDPWHYAQAKQHLEWVQTMNNELDALEKDHTWILTSLPRRKRALTSKWVYKTKYKPDGYVERHKAWLVIRGFEQVKDKDYKHTFRAYLLQTYSTCTYFYQLQHAPTYLNLLKPANY